MSTITTVEEAREVLRLFAIGGVDHRWAGKCPDALGGFSADARDPECPVCQALTVLHNPAQQPPVRGDTDALRSVIGSVIAGRMDLYPRRARVHLLGHDLSAVIDATTQAVLAHLSRTPAAEVSQEAPEFCGCGHPAVMHEPECYDVCGCEGFHDNVAPAAPTVNAEDAWDDGFEARHAWQPSASNGTPLDPPRNPYRRAL